ncbi:MAG TPA: hypothetical protein PLB91_06905 [Spirochaetales bacterium]|nr:hypothetical protein [Spirochaetales bacterium]HRY52991.1 hypothetical protein [Spirochaetia bacterium]
MLETAKVLAWPVVVVVVALVILALSRGGRVRGVSASKEGGVKIDFAPLEARGTTEYYLNRRIQEIDEEIRASATEAVRQLRKPIYRAIAGAGLCSASMRAVAGELSGVMYHAVDENNLKERVARPARADYIAAKLAAMRDEYLDLAAEREDCPSASQAPYPPWAEIEESLRSALEAWSETIAGVVAAGCKDKLKAYQEYRPQFEAAGDTKYAAIVDECIAKNQGYIAGLEET